MSNNFTITNNSVISNRYFTLYGSEDFLDDGGYPRETKETTKTLAKSIQNKKPRQLTNQNFQHRYYVKASPLKQIYNPISIHSVQDNNKNEFSGLHKTYKQEWLFIEVTESVFNKYIEFLKTKNSQWIKAAQKEID